MQNKAEVILGIDPGTNIMGFGCIYGSGDQWKCIDAGILQLEKKHTAFEKLNSIYHKCTELLHEHKPDSVAIEAPFYGKNVQSMLKLGRAQGVCIAAVTSMGISIEEYAPRRIKQSITGNGNASKEQVSRMLVHILGETELLNNIATDASDAVAAALCHAFSKNSLLGKKTGKESWEQFIRQNPDKLI